MKKLLQIIPFIALFILVNHQVSAQGLFGKLKQKIKDKTDQRIDQKEDKAIDKTLDKVDGTNTGTSAKNNTTNNSNTNATNNSTSSVPTIKTYQNYDFVPGDTILFADDFSTDQEGEFPAHWSLMKGQGTVNKNGDKYVFNLLNGNYAKVKPRMKTANYLSETFTIEFDAFAYSGADCGYGANIIFVDKENPEGNEEINVLRSKSASTGYFPHDFEGVPVKQSDEDFWKHWHHIAIAYKKPQMKVYLDQTRVLVVPEIGFDPLAIIFGGIAGDESCPISISNVRIASGGNMNMIGKKFTESKIVTHGINFDIDKATIKPESMGTLNMIVGVLKANPALKFEIDGHTDNTGAAQHNLELSQQRAEAVKTQLVSMGIDASRLTTKGFGDTKPISDNSTIEGKANNRRVEFVKM